MAMDDVHCGHRQPPLQPALRSKVAENSKSPSLLATARVAQCLFATWNVTDWRRSTSAKVPVTTGL